MSLTRGCGPPHTLSGWWSIYTTPGKIDPSYRGTIGVSDSGVASVDVTVLDSSCWFERGLSASRPKTFLRWSLQFAQLIDLRIR